MPIEIDDLVHYAVLWETQGADGYGDQRVLSPIEIKCRWHIGATLSNSPLANTYNLRGIVYVDRVLSLQSILWQGRLEAQLATQNPTPLYQVVNYQEVYDVKGIDVRRKVTIAAWNNRLPVGVG